MKGGGAVLWNAFSSGQDLRISHFDCLLLTLIDLRWGLESSHTSWWSAPLREKPWWDNMGSKESFCCVETIHWAGEDQSYNDWHCFDLCMGEERSFMALEGICWNALEKWQDPSSLPSGLLWNTRLFLDHCINVFSVNSGCGLQKI